MKKLVYKVITLLVFIWFIDSFKVAFAQGDKVPAFSSYAEKIYLQLDNKVYTSDQTIWFKAILTTAGDHNLSELSGVLYVELIDPYENIIEKKVIKIVQGLGQGFFQLTPMYAYGIYQVRAYTEWNKNFGNDFLFKEYILVSGKERTSDFNLIKSLTLIQDPAKGSQLKVELSPVVNDSIAGKAVRFVLEADDKRDTFSLRKNRDNQYLIDKRIPAETEIVSIHVETENHTGYSRTIILDTNYLDVQFFPESGELVQGLPGVLGYKAVDYSGKGKEVQGKILNSKGETIAPFHSNLLGMGVVQLNTIDRDAHYTAILFAPDGKEIQKRFRFPSIAETGNILSVRKQGDKILVKAYSNYRVEDTVTIKTSCRGVDYFAFKGRFKNGVFEFPVNATSFPEGIVAFTLFIGKEKMPVAERLFFNQQPADRLDINVTLDRDEYTQRDKSELSIDIKDASGQVVDASVSVLVQDNAVQGTSSDMRPSILSYLLVSSDLKGIIEKPGYYFENEKERFNDLDALLLTQGWSKYNYTKDTGNFRFQPEANLVITGSVKGGLSDKKTMKGAKLSMMVFGDHPQADEQKTDSLGRFRFVLKDDYSNKLPVLIQSANKSSKNTSYLVTIDKKEAPPVVFHHYRKVDKPDSIMQAYIEQNVSNQKKLDSIRVAAEGVMLQEVIVKSRVLYPEQKEVTEKYGEAKVIISGDRIREKEAKWSYGLYSVLMFNFPEQVMVRNFGNGFLYASLTSNMEVTLVVIDGIPVLGRDYNSISSIPPSEVKSFELIPYAKNFHALYCEAIYCGLGTPSVGNVIAIYTYAGKGLFGTKPTIGINKMEVPVFSPTREFYTPKHETIKPEDWQKPDLRTLIHWQPDVITDTTGKSSISFYNGDIIGKKKIIIEAITIDGKLGYGEFYYDVKKKN